MTVNPTQSDPGAESAAPQFPATSELVSGHDADFVEAEALDARVFSAFEDATRRRRCPIR